MVSMIEKFGEYSLNFFQEVGEAIVLFFESLKTVTQFRFSRARQRLYHQLLLIGNESVPMVCILGAFVGMVLTLQMGYQLQKVGTERFIGAIVALTLTKELAPVFTAYLLAGKVGAAITAEIGTMKVNQEIDALRSLGIDPIRFLTLPRILSGILVTPILVLFADIVGILAGSILAFIYLGVSMVEYKNSIIEMVIFSDVLEGMIKGAVFGGMICLIGCHQGFKTTDGAEGVGKFTTRSVVISFIAILVFDYFLSRFMLR